MLFNDSCYKSLSSELIWLQYYQIIILLAPITAFFFPHPVFVFHTSSVAEPCGRLSVSQYLYTCTHISLLGSLIVLFVGPWGHMFFFLAQSFAHDGCFFLFPEVSGSNGTNSGGAVVWVVWDPHGSPELLDFTLSKCHRHDALPTVPLRGITPCGNEHTLKILNNGSVFA